MTAARDAYEEAQRAAAEASATVAAFDATIDELERRAAAVADVEAASLAGAVADLVRAGGKGELPGPRLASLASDRAVIAAAIVEAGRQRAQAQRAAGYARADEMDALALVKAEEAEALGGQVAELLAQATAAGGGTYTQSRGGDNSRAGLLDLESRNLRHEAMLLRRRLDREAPMG